MKRRSFLGSIIAVPAVACCERRLPSWTPTKAVIDPPQDVNIVRRFSKFIASRSCEKGQIVAMDGPGKIMPAPKLPKDAEWILGVAENSAAKGEWVNVLIHGWSKVSALKT